MFVDVRMNHEPEWNFFQMAQMKNFVGYSDNHRARECLIVRGKRLATFQMRNDSNVLRFLAEVLARNNPGGNLLSLFSEKYIEMSNWSITHIFHITINKKPITITTNII